MPGSNRDSAVFRPRGLQLTRIETFTDAAFAFALTLLVISFEPPSDIAALREALMQVPAFLLSGGMLMMFWWAHHGWSRRYGLDDYATFLLSCTLVLTVLIYVYPLRFMFGLMMSWIGSNTGLPLGGAISISDPADVSRLFVLYGIGFSAMSALVLLLYAHAWGLRDVLALDATERYETRSIMGAWTILTATGCASIVVALLLPSMPGMGGWVYAPLGFVMPLYGRYRDRRRSVILGSAAAQPPAAATTA